MEAPISERETVDLHLHVVQSIRLSDDAMKQVFQAGVKDPPEGEGFPIPCHGVPLGETKRSCFK